MPLLELSPPSLLRRRFLLGGVSWAALPFVVPVILATEGARAAAPEAVAWRLNLKGGLPNDCQLAFARVASIGSGAFCVEGDSRHDISTWWHSCIFVPAGRLKAGQDYVATVSYEILERADPDCYFYVFARSGGLGQGADHWQTWSGEAAQRGVAKLRLSLTANDYSVTAGIYKRGAMRILDMQIESGSGWTEQPLTGALIGPVPPLPTGAQPFTVEPPANAEGPVLYLSDFGAVANGGVPPEAGADRNLVALQIALEQCRKVKASKLVAAKGVYRFTSGSSIVFKDLADFIFDGGGSTFLFHVIAGGAGVNISDCQRSVLSNFNLDWDWKIDPPVWVGRVTALAPDQSSFVMRFETAAPLDPKAWVSLNPLDEKLRAPGAGVELGGFDPTRIDKIDAQTVRVWPKNHIKPKVGQLYLLRHYTYEKHAVTMGGNSHLSLQGINIYSFPGIGFVTGGDQHHFELVRCKIAPPPGERRPITTSADGFHVAQSQGFIRLEGCEIAFTGDDCVNIHDNMHMGVRRVDDYTLVAIGLVLWRCPFAAGDPVEIRKGDYSPTGFTAKLKSATANYKTNEVMLVFSEKLPARVSTDAILFNRRYGSHNVIIRDCYFHENRARGVLVNGADWLIENNRFFHNQHAGILLNVVVSPGLWSEGFGARNVIVRGNRFEACNPMGASDGAVIQMGATVRQETTAYPLLDGDLFEANQFAETPGVVLQAASFKSLVFRNNAITNHAPPPVPAPMRGGVRAELGTGLWVEGNTWTTAAGLGVPALFYDRDTARGVACGRNTLKA